MPSRKIPEDHIRKAAFYIWIEEGRPEGKAEEHWETARARLAAERAPKRKAPAKKASAGDKPAARAKPAPKTEKAPAKTGRAKAKTANKPKTDS